MMKVLVLCFLACFLLVDPLHLGAQPPSPQVEHGIIDLRGYDFTRSGTKRLTGQWEFQWKKLLTPSTFDSQPGAAGITIPGTWSQFDELGYGTYRLRMLLAADHAGLSVFFPAINSSSRIWVNNEPVSESGKVAETEAAYIPKLTSVLVPLPDDPDTIEIVLQVANFSSYNGGIWSTPKVDRTTVLVEGLNQANGIENFFAGSLIAMACYQLILYFLYHRGKPFLWLALICFGVAIRSMVMHGGSFLLPNIFPSVTPDIWKKLEFGAVYAMVAFFPLYVYHLFKEYAPRRPLQIFVGISIFLCIAVLLTPQAIYGLLLELSHLSYLLCFVYAIYSIGKAWRAGNKDAKIILFGVVACFPFILLEIMKNSVFIGLEIPSMYYVEIGVLVFLLFQVYLLANHYAKSYRALETMNQDLEGIVSERTQELVAASNVRDKLLSVISHDVRSPLNSLHAMLELYNKGRVTQAEFSHFAERIESDLGNTGLLVENILLWTSSQLKGAKPVREKFNLRDLIEQNAELFKTPAANKRITIKRHLTESLEINWDKQVVHLALRNLLANAIKFSHHGGDIDVSATRQGKEIHLTVRDYGVGMDSATMESIMSNKRAMTTDGTGNERGTGLGLSLCREYLIHTGGSLIAESLHGKGSQFTIVIPQ